MLEIVDNTIKVQETPHWCMDPPINFFLFIYLLLTSFIISLSHLPLFLLLLYYRVVQIINTTYV